MCQRGVVEAPALSRDGATDGHRDATRGGFLALRRLCHSDVLQQLPCFRHGSPLDRRATRTHTQRQVWSLTAGVPAGLLGAAVCACHMCGFLSLFTAHGLRRVCGHRAVASPEITLPWGTACWGGAILGKKSEMTSMMSVFIWRNIVLKRAFLWNEKTHVSLLHLHDLCNIPIWLLLFFKYLLVDIQFAASLIVYSPKIHLRWGFYALQFHNISKFRMF